MGVPVNHHNNCTRAEAITNLIESIALEECAIANILKAEGEEIQKAVCMHCATIEDLVELNESVKEVVQACTYFQGKLKENLEYFEGCLCSSNRFSRGCDAE